MTVVLIKSMRRFLKNKLIIIFFLVAIFGGVVIPFLGIEHSKILGFLLVIVIGIGLNICLCVVGAVDRRKIFLRRECMTTDEVSRLFYPELDSLTVIGLWNEVADIFGVPSGKIRPEDRFGYELHGTWFVDNEVDEFWCCVNEKILFYKVDIDPSEINSMNDYICIFANAMNNKQA